MSMPARTSGMGFALQPRNIEEAFRMAEMLSGSQMVPKSYQNKPQDALVAMMMGSELGLNPIQSLANIAVINGKPAIYGDALLALVQNHPRFGGHQETFDEASMTAACTVWRKGDEQKHTVTFSQSDAQLAGLWGKQGPWANYPKRMLMWRARGYALRDKFAHALGGLITIEEARDIPEQDMGMASRADTAEPAQSEPVQIEYYPVESFENNFPAWKKAIEAGKQTPERVIAMVSSKGALTDEQEQKILEISSGAAQ